MILKSEHTISFATISLTKQFNLICLSRCDKLMCHYSTIDLQKKREYTQNYFQKSDIRNVMVIEYKALIFKVRLKIIPEKNLRFHDQKELRLFKFCKLWLF